MPDRARLVQRVVDDQDILIASFLTRLKALNKSPNTLRNYRRSVQKLRGRYPHVPFEQLSAEHIERHIYARDIGPRSQVNELAGLQTFYEFLRRQKRLIKTNPCHDVERPTYEEPLQPSPTFEEFEALYRRCATLEESIMVNLYYQTAVRLREGLRLRVHHVDVEHREIRIVRGKRQKDRVVVFDPKPLPVHLHLGPILREFVAGRDPDAYLFPSPRKLGQHLSADRVGDLLERLGNEIGLPFKLTAHLLRHGWSVWSAEVGLPIDMAQIQLGHESIATTARVYRRIQTPRLKRSMDQFMGPPVRD